MSSSSMASTFSPSGVNVPPFNQMGRPSRQTSSYGDFWQPDPNSWVQNPPQASVYNSANPEYMRQYVSRHNQPSKYVIKKCVKKCDKNVLYVNIGIYYVCIY